MGADLDAVLLGQAHGLAHVIENRKRGIRKRRWRHRQEHQAFVVAHLVKAEASPMSQLMVTILVVLIRLRHFPRTFAP